MTTHERPAGLNHEVGHEVDPEEVALVWMDANQALIARWIPERDEPRVEHILSGVTPRRKAVGSVRRGPHRPEGGGRVPGHGTTGRHVEEMDRYLAELVHALDGLSLIEVRGRGQPYLDLAAILDDLAGRSGDDFILATEATSRRPSERQLMARLRKMVDRELPRRRMGRYRMTPNVPTGPTGRPMPAAAGRRTLRPAALPEQVEITREVEAMLSDDAPAPDERVRAEAGGR